jgi:hypothetical protein
VCTSSGTCGQGSASMQYGPDCARDTNGWYCPASCLRSPTQFGTADGTCSAESCVRNQGASCY